MAPPASRTVARAGWTMGDQALSSLTNFALGVLVARTVDQRAFGAFSVAYMVYLLLLGAARAAASEPFVVAFTGRPEEDRRAAAARATGFSLLVGVVAGALGVGIGAAVGGVLGTSLVALGVCLPGLMLQDAYRFVFMADGRPGKAAGNDAIWAAAQLVGVSLLVVIGGPGVGALIAAWGVAAAIAAAAAIGMGAPAPHLRGATSWVAAHRELVGGFLFDFVLLIAAAQLSLYLVGLLAGLAALGSLRAASVLLGPLTTFLHGVRMVALPETVRFIRRHGSPGRVAASVSAGAVAVSAAFTVAVLVLPDSAGEVLLGDSWQAGRQVFPWLAIATIAVASNTGPLTALRSLAEVRKIVRGRTIVAPLGLALGAAGALMGDAEGAAIGIALGNWIGAAVWWRLLALPTRRTGEQDPPAGDPGAGPELTAITFGRHTITREQD